MGGRLSTVALIPARGGSKRLPRKNIALLHGRPLLEYVIGAALECGRFDDVFVSTDDAEIARVARTAGADVHVRPAHLGTDTSTVVEVSTDFLNWYDSQKPSIDVLAVMLPTAALMRSDDIAGGLNALGPDVDAVMAVTTYLESPFQALHDVGGYLRPYFAEFSRRSQDLPPVYVDSGYFYAVRAAAFRGGRSFYLPRLRGYAIPRERSIDIDEPAHLRIAEALLGTSAAS